MQFSSAVESMYSENVPSALHLVAHNRHIFPNPLVPPQLSPSYAKAKLHNNKPEALNILRHDLAFI